MKVKARHVAVAVAVAAGAAALAVVGGVVMVSRLVDAEFVEGVFNDALGPATDGRYVVGLDSVAIAPWRGDLAIEGIRLQPAEFGGDTLGAEGPAIRFSGDVGHVGVQGIRLWALVRHRDLIARSFEVTGPRLAILMIEREVPPAGPPAESAAAAEVDGAATDTVAETHHEAVAGALPRIRIDGVAIRDVDVTLVTLRHGEEGPGEAPLTERLRGLSLTLEALDIDPNRPPSEERFLFSEDVRLTFEGLDLEARNGSRVTLGPLEASTRDRSIHLAGVSLTPGQSRADYLGGEGPGGDRVELSTGRVSVSGLRWYRLLEGLAAEADTVRVDSLAIHVLSDKHRTGGPRTSEPPMPHDIIRELPVGLTVDVVEVTNGTVTYAERGPRSERPGSVTFADIHARIANLTNDPARVAAEGPTTLEAETRVFEAAPASVRASLPLLSPPPTMDFFARIGPFPATSVNAILPDLEGIRVTEGHVDSARVDIRYYPGGASGVVMVGYSDLSIRQEDRNTGDQSLGQRLTSFVANTFVIRGSNGPRDDRGPREGEVRYQTPRFAPFFKIFWEAMRGGLIDVVK